MDPLGKVLPDKDTTFVFMLESLKRGHEIYFLEQRDVFALGHQVAGHTRRCVVERLATPHFGFIDHARNLPLEGFDAIFMRKDPPADDNYIYTTMLLSLVDSRQTFILNNPAGLREANEKLYALNFPHVIPPTIVTYESARLKTFMEEQGG